MSERLTTNMVEVQRQNLRQALPAAQYKWRDNTLEQDYIGLLLKAVDDLFDVTQHLTARVSELESRTSEAPDA